MSQGSVRTPSITERRSGNGAGDTCRAILPWLLGRGFPRNGMKNEQKMGAHDYPSFASFVRLYRMEHHTTLSVRAASIAAGFPEGTWSSVENGRWPRPASPKLHAIAHVLGVRPWPLAIIAGPKKETSSLNRIEEIVLDRLTLPTSWGALQGGAFLRRSRRKRPLAMVVAHWAERWPRIPGMDVEAWNAIETKGILPPLPEPPMPFQPPPGSRLDTLSGGWLWAFLDAATGDSQWAYYLLPGLSLAMGKSHPTVAQAADDKALWDSLAQAYSRSHTQQPEAFDDAGYYTEAVAVARAMQEAASTATSSQRLARISAVWETLTQEQQEHIMAVTEDLGKGK